VRPQAAIFDVDGTLCDVSTIRYLVDGTVKPRQFDEFHRLSAGCPCHRWVVEAAHEQARRGRVVLVVTARMDRWRGLTSQWLERFAVPWTALWMRRDDDYRPDVVVKQEILTEIQRAYDVVTVWEDQPTLADQVWRPTGAHVTLVPGWWPERQPT
jgi:hypothetical protein